MNRLACINGVLVGVLGFALTGCSTYIEGYYFQPRPALTGIPPTTQNAPPPVSAMATVVGIRRKDKDLHLPTSVEVRMRIDNNGVTPVVFDPKSLELSNGTFLKFAPPLLDPPNTGPLTIAPHQAAVLGAFFPFPRGQNYENTDLGSLQLRWEIGYEGHSVPQVVYFTREMPVYSYYYLPYYVYEQPFYYHGYYRGQR